MKKKIVCILGMHRSGSSFVSGCIKGLGVYIGGDDELIAGDRFNESGYNENKELSYLGEELLISLGGNHIRPPHLESGWEKSSALDPFRARAKTLIDTKFSGQMIWGWKDPRNSLLLPFWRQIVQPTHYIIVLRNPLEVAESLLRRNGVGIRHGTELWLLHAVSALANTTACKRKIIFFEDARESLAGLEEELRMFLYGDDEGIQPIFGARPQYIESLVHHLHGEEKVFANEDVHPFTKHIYRAFREEAKSANGSKTDGTLQLFHGSLLKLAETEPELIMGTSSLKNCLVSSKDVNLARPGELENRIASLSQTISERDYRITNLSQTISERDHRIASLSQTISEQGDRVINLEKSVLERNEIITSFTKTISAQGDRIASLEESLLERDHRIASLGQIIAEKDAYTKELISVVAQLRIEADSLFKRLEQVLNSKSWRLTRLLRAAARLAKHGHRLAPAKKLFFQLARSIGRALPFPYWMKTRCRSALIGLAYPDQTTPVAHAAEPNLDKFSNSSAGPMRPECCRLKPGLVSVVLPVFNQAYLLSESIESVLTQTYENFELIVVNDGSTDGVEAVLERYLGNPKIQCFTQANQRLPKALSNGFSQASGEFWTWTSADNIMEPRMLEMLVGKLQSDPMLGLVYADYYAIDDRGNLLQDRNWRSHNRPNPRSGEIRLPRSASNLNTVQDNFIGPCFMYRGWIGRCIGDYDPQLGVEDYDYWMRINAFFRVQHLGSDALLYRYRVHDNTLSAKAHEHGILEKVHRLMAYEKERSAFYKSPMKYMVDSTGKDWLVSRGVQPNSIRPRLEGEDQFQNTGDLLVVGSNTVLSNVDYFLQVDKPFVVIFDKADTNYQKLHRVLAKDCLALVSDNITAAHVRLVSDCPMLDATSRSAFQGMFAFAKNHQFLSATRTSKDLHRDPPQHIIKPHGRHILLQVDSFTQGGMENVVIDLALSLQESGFKVTIGNRGKSGDAAKKAREHGLRVDSFEPDIARDAYIDFLREQKVDLVNAHYSIFGAEACSAANIPFVQTIHNSYVWFDPETIQRYRDADRCTASYVCVSNTAARYAGVVLGLDAGKMMVIPNGIDPNTIDLARFEENRFQLRKSWGVASDTPLFLNVASIMATKAQLPLVNAFVKVVKIFPDARLILLGGIMEPQYHRAIENRIRDLGLQKHVLFAGYDRDVAKYYHACDVFVLPSFWEGWSLSLGEAIANGLSCVITDVGSAYEFDDNENVEIVQPPFGDITALNHRNLGKFVYGENVNFENRLAEAMIKSASKPRAAIDESLAKRLDRGNAYRTYASFFSSV